MAKLYEKNTWVDEVLAGNERYNILEDGGTPIESNVQIELETEVTQAGTAVDADKMNNIEDGIDAIDTRVDTVTQDQTHAATGKDTPIDADELPLVDSAASNVLKKLTWANLKATLKTYLDTLYRPVSEADGWTAAGETWTYVSANSFTVPGDQTAKYKTGTKLKCDNSGTKFLSVVSSSYGAPNTTVTVTGGNDYSLANAAITSNFYSYTENPQGFPGFFNWTPTFISSGATFTYNLQAGTFCIRGRTITVQGFISLTGAPGGTTSNQLTMALPLTAATITNWSMYFANYWSIITLPANMTYLITYVSSGGAAVTLRYTGSGQTAGNLLASALGSNAVLGFAGQYWLP